MFNVLSFCFYGWLSCLIRWRQHWKWRECNMLFVTAWNGYIWYYQILPANNYLRYGLNGYISNATNIHSNQSIFFQWNASIRWTKVWYPENVQFGRQDFLFITGYNLCSGGLFSTVNDCIHMSHTYLPIILLTMDAITGNLVWWQHSIDFYLYFYLLRVPCPAIRTTQSETKTK